MNCTMDDLNEYEINEYIQWFTTESTYNKHRTAMSQMFSNSISELVVSLGKRNNAEMRTLYSDEELEIDFSF